VSAIQERIRGIVDDAFAPAKCTLKSSLNELEVTIDEGDRINFYFDYENDEVFARSSRMRVPNSMYETYLKQIIRFISRLESILQPTEKFYSLEIAFTRNPYFGFFLQNVPHQQIDDFHCVFRSNIAENCALEATKTSLKLSTTDCFALGDVGEEYLALSGHLLPSK
jgi:hypothetical protein